MNKKIRILLLGGTKDSINIIKMIKKQYKESFILSTTTTDYGAKLAKDAGSDETIAKPLPKDEILEILEKNNFDILLDSTHPFASHISQTAIDVSKIAKIKYIRFERYMFNFDNISYENIHHVNSFEDAGKLIIKEFDKGNVLHFAGFKTIQDILKSVALENFYPRIITVPLAMKKCEELGIAKDHIIEMKGVATKEENIDLIKKHKAIAIITKESGETGGIVEKIEAAKECGIAIVIISRPKIKDLKNEIVINDLESLEKEINKIIIKNY